MRVEPELRRDGRAKMTPLDLFVATKVEVGPRPFVVEMKSRGANERRECRIVSDDYPWVPNQRHRMNLPAWRLIREVVPRDVGERARIEIRKWRKLFKRLVRYSE